MHVWTEGKVRGMELLSTIVPHSLHACLYTSPTNHLAFELEMRWWSTRPKEEDLQLGEDEAARIIKRQSALVRNSELLHPLSGLEGALLRLWHENGGSWPFVPPSHTPLTSPPSGLVPFGTFIIIIPFLTAVSFPRHRFHGLTAGEDCSTSQLLSPFFLVATGCRVGWTNYWVTISLQMFKDPTCIEERKKKRTCVNVLTALCTTTKGRVTYAYVAINVPSLYT